MNNNPKVINLYTDEDADNVLQTLNQLKIYTEEELRDNVVNAMAKNLFNTLYYNARDSRREQLLVTGIELHWKENNNLKELEYNISKLEHEKFTAQREVYKLQNIRNDRIDIHDDLELMALANNIAIIDCRYNIQIFDKFGKANIYQDTLEEDLAELYESIRRDKDNNYIGADTIICDYRNS